MASDLRRRALRNAGARLATPGETRTYDVRSQEDAATAPPVVVTVTVLAACPVMVDHDHRCGMARGEPKARTLHDSWTNTEYVITVPERHPCGHATMHFRLIAEAAGLRRMLDTA